MQTSKYLKRLGNLTFTEFNIYQKRVLVRTENNLQNIRPPSRWKLQIKFTVSETEMGPKFWFSWISQSSKEKDILNVFVYFDVYVCVVNVIEVLCTS